MTIAERFRSWWPGAQLPLSARHGRLGERAARKHLQRQEMKFLTANFRSDRGEIDLIFKVDDAALSAATPRRRWRSPLASLLHKPNYCLIFVEVKTRSSEDWTRPAASVNAEKRGHLSRCALDYLRLLKNPPVKIRFDVVEVLLENGAVREIRHLPNTFHLSAPYRYG